MSAEVVVPRQSSSVAGAYPVKPRFIHLQNLPLIVSAVLIFLSVLRVYYFSNFNVSVAMQILAVISWPTVLVGTILPLLVNVAPLIAAYFLAQWRTMADPSGKVRYIGIWLGLIGLGPILIMEMTALTAVANAVGAAAIVVWARKTRRSYTLKSLLSTSWGRLIAFCVAVGLVFPTLSLPWQAFERITYGSDRTAGAGDFFVIGEQGGRLLLATESEKKLFWIKTENITDRAPCSIVSRAPRPWWDVSISSDQRQKSTDPCDSLLEVSLKLPGATLKSR